MDSVSDPTVEDQIAYYRARAPEYDDWFYRRGRYDRGEHWNGLWFEEAEAVARQLGAIPKCESILELASGTGIWTKRLISIGRQVTAVDASPEVIEINRERVGSEAVQYVQADLFDWEPNQEFDLVFFSFWLSHVPPERLDQFLETVRGATKSGGRIFVIDSLPDEQSSAVDHPPKQPDQIYETRKLDNGRNYRVVKVYYPPEALAGIFARHGFDVEVHTTDRFFWYVSGEKRS
ncbi:MAG: class I SAM-dependent methyltransferase [Bryobacteraceae bacterium]|jgi:demethylmenaquinone methyltransferase/2-methoxy-6-polyprenyl-1,4-benzoquinol methylase